MKNEMRWDGWIIKKTSWQENISWIGEFETKHYIEQDQQQIESIVLIMVVVRMMATIIRILI